MLINQNCSALSGVCFLSILVCFTKTKTSTAIMLYCYYVVLLLLLCCCYFPAHTGVHHHHHHCIFMLHSVLIIIIIKNWPSCFVLLCSLVWGCITEALCSWMWIPCSHLQDAAATLKTWGWMGNAIIVQSFDFFNNINNWGCVRKNLLTKLVHTRTPTRTHAHAPTHARRRTCWTTSLKARLSRVEG